MKSKSRDTNRIDKLNGEFQKEIYEIITRKLKNPNVCAMVSITAVDTSKDLSHAKVYISVFSTDENKKKATLDAIVSDAKRIRYELAKSMTIRTVPELHFVYDDSIDYGDKMDKLLNKIAKSDSKN